jgi:hypothetical protein
MQRDQPCFTIHVGVACQLIDGEPSSILAGTIQKGVDWLPIYNMLYAWPVSQRRLKIIEGGQQGIIQLYVSRRTKD